MTLEAAYNLPGMPNRPPKESEYKLMLQDHRAGVFYTDTPYANLYRNQLEWRGPSSRDDANNRTYSEMPWAGGCWDGQRHLSGDDVAIHMARGGRGVGGLPGGNIWEEDDPFEDDTP